MAAVAAALTCASVPTSHTQHVPRREGYRAGDPNASHVGSNHIGTVRPYVDVVCRHVGCRCGVEDKGAEQAKTAEVPAASVARRALGGIRENSGR